MKRKGKLLEKFLLALIFVIAIVSTNLYVNKAEALTFSWKWPTYNQSLNMHNVTGDSIWKTASYSAAPKWNVANSNLSLTVTETNVDTDIYLSYMGPSSPDGYYAVVLVYDTLSNLMTGTNTGYADEAKIRMYSNSVNALEYTKKVQMLVHEIGHAIGLAHSTGTVSVMNESKVFSYSGPTTYDSNDVANKY